MRTVEVIVEHAGNNLSAYIEGAPVITVGNNIREIEDNMKEALIFGGQSESLRNSQRGIFLKI